MNDRNEKGQFVKGIIPHNVGKHPFEYMPKEKYDKMMKTKFPKGNLPHATLPEGTVTRCLHRRKGVVVGYDWFINIDWRGNRKNHYNYRRYLWEVENQTDAPTGAIFTALDGNFNKKPTIENVEMIDRAELVKRNTRRK